MKPDHLNKGHETEVLHTKCTISPFNIIQAYTIFIYVLFGQIKDMITRFCVLFVNIIVADECKL